MGPHYYIEYEIKRRIKKYTFNTSVSMYGFPKNNWEVADIITLGENVNFQITNSKEFIYDHFNIKRNNNFNQLEISSKLAFASYKNCIKCGNKANKNFGICIIHGPKYNIICVHTKNYLIIGCHKMDYGYAKTIQGVYESILYLLENYAFDNTSGISYHVYKTGYYANELINNKKLTAFAYKKYILVENPVEVKKIFLEFDAYNHKHLEFIKSNKDVDIEKNIFDTDYYEIHKYFNIDVNQLWLSNTSDFYKKIRLFNPAEIIVDNPNNLLKIRNLGYSLESKEKIKHLNAKIFVLNDDLTLSKLELK